MTQKSSASSQTEPLPKATSQTQKLQLQLAEKLMGGFDFVLSGRSKYYQENPDKIPPPSAIPMIVNSYSTVNMSISAGASLIPGPWGMAAAIPEIALLIRNQLAMIYDIGMAYGKHKALNKELLAGVFLSAMGVGTGGLLVMHGGKVLVRRVALRVFQQVVRLLAGKVTQQLLKSMISKWVPIIGAAAMGVWANYSTRQIGKRATEILSKQIEVSDEVFTAEDFLESQIAATTTMAPVGDSKFTVLKITALINLMKVDKRLKSEEVSYIQSLIENSELNAATQIDLANLIDVETRNSIEFSHFAKEPDEAIALLIDLVGLAKRDGELHLAEKIYIKQAGKLMGLSESDVEEALTMA